MIKREDYQFIAELITSLTGILYPEREYYRLDARISSLVDTFGCGDVNGLVSLLKYEKTPAVERELVNVCVNNETFFFRDKKMFEFLNEELRLRAHKSGVGARIWSSACSTGQEIYSLAMLIEEDEELKNRNILIDATDISSRALSYAERGTYNNLEVQRGLPIRKLLAFFTKNEDDTWTAKDALKKRLRFSHFNLTGTTYPEKVYDIILCRNVLIYQGPESKQKIIEKLYTSLSDEGLLVMGAGESLIGVKSGFRVDNTGPVLCYRKGDQKTLAAS